MKILIGTSGWMYGDWVGKFYPEGLKDRDKLKFFTTQFSTVEINSTFYHLPKENTFKNWHDQAPKDFIYSLKLGRFVIRNKRLILDDESKSYIRTFLKYSRQLKEHLGCVLIQLPYSFKFDSEVIEKFFKFLSGTVKRMKFRPDFAIEFRNTSWFNEDTCEILRKFNVSQVVSNSSRWPESKEVTADFAYIRLHGPERLFASSYSNKQLKDWTAFIKSYKSIKKCYVYFNNDMFGYAIDNAKYLITCLK